MVLIGDPADRGLDVTQALPTCASIRGWLRDAVVHELLFSAVTVEGAARV